MATVTKFNPIFRDKLKQALRATAEELDAAFEATIESSIFPWPRPTKRQSGRTVNSPRDIVDTSDFKRSQKYSIKSAYLARFVWAISYAAIIRYGYTTRAGNEYPGRDWIGETFKQIPPVDIFAGQCRRVFR